MVEPVASKKTSSPPPQNEEPSTLEWIVGWLHFFNPLRSSPSLKGEVTPLSGLELKEDAPFEEFTTYVNKYDAAFTEVSAAIDALNAQSDSKPVYLRLEKLRQMKIQAEKWKVLNVGGEHNFEAADTILNKDIYELEKALYKALPDSASSSLVQESATAQSLSLPVGLENNGTDCFFNALLQMIFPEPELAQLIVDQDDQHGWLKQAYWLYSNAQESGKTLNLGVLRDRYSSINNGQQDTHEAFMQLIAPLKNSSLAFEINYTTTYSSSSDSDESGSEEQPPPVKKEEAQFCLELQFEKDSAIENLFESYTAEEFLNENEKNPTEIDQFEGKVTPESRSIKLKTAPKHFLINIKRYKQVSLTHAKKLSGPLGMQEVFYLPPSCTSDEKGAKYELRSYAYHRGGTGGGHYWCNSKRGGEYHCCNDAKVSELKPKTFLKEAQEAHFLYAVRIDDETSQEEIKKGIEANKQKASEMHFESTLTKAEKIISPKEKESNLLPLFTSLLEKGDEEKLKKVYDAMPTSFTKFVEKMLGTDTPVKERLLELKTVEKKIAPIEGNVVEQYAYLTKKLESSSIDYGVFALVKKAMAKLPKLEKKQILLKHWQTLPEDQIVDIMTIPAYGKKLASRTSKEKPLDSVIKAEIEKIEEEIKNSNKLKKSWEKTASLADGILNKTS